MDLIQQFQEILKKKHIKAYIIPTFDYHNSEYVSEYFKAREFLTGFTGSAGTLVISQEEALLWTDGRYHIQAAKQMEGRPITLMKQGLTGVPSIKEYLKYTIKENDVLGFDGKVVSTSFLLDLLKEIPNLKTKVDEDLVSILWEERPKMPSSMLYKLEPFFSGKSFHEKKTAVVEKIKELDCDVHILSALEDQAWLYNLRANDVLHTPVFLAYTIFIEDECHLFIDENKIDRSIEKYLKENNVLIHDYFDFYAFIKTLRDHKILVDFKKINCTTYLEINQHNILINKNDPTFVMKCIKNKTEIENTIIAHKKDGIAFTKWMYFIKNNISKEKSITELSASDYLEKLRSEQEGFVDLSFNTICAYNENAAMMHYSATIDNNALLKPEGLLLVDSGGHYLEGTTDITRTIALGTISEAMKLHFTTVLKSVIALTQAVFLKGVRGINLDILARGPIWKLLIDYKCGTGHGVGYLLSVHEGPNGFRWQTVPERNDSAIFEEGMITTNEPGIYLENKYGIRIENEMICVPMGKTEFGEFLGFETITYAPIDLDAINITLLNDEEKNWLNRYHQMVYDTLSPAMSEEENEWLKIYTRSI